ncbi:MAG: hypothetical protein WBO12_18475 [Xanthobacteraceae bacterium]
MPGIPQISSMELTSLTDKKNQIALTKGDAIFPRIGKISNACQSKPRSGTTFSNRAAYYQYCSDTDLRPLRHGDLACRFSVSSQRVDLAWLPTN